MKVYVASSWRNSLQPWVVAWLMKCGLDVYDFRNPAPGNSGFSWSEIDPAWQSWTERQFVSALKHPIADRGFGYDMGALAGCDACLLVLPCGKSAHLELGYAVGANKHTAILMPGKDEPELMYKMVGSIIHTPAALTEWAEWLSEGAPSRRARVVRA